MRGMDPDIMSKKVLGGSRLEVRARFAIDCDGVKSEKHLGVSQRELRDDQWNSTGKRTPGAGDSAARPTDVRRR